jgi:hypothetical protein
MNVEHLVNYFEKMGHSVLQTDSACWYNVNRGAYNSIPFHRLIEPTSDELRELWRTRRVAVVRYPTDVRSALGQSSYMFVVRNKEYDLEGLSSNTRSHTRRGLKNCTVRQVDFPFLAHEGLSLHVSTLNRQGYDIPATIKEYWERICLVAGETPDFEAWGAFVGDQLAALAIGFVIEDCYQVSTVRSQKELLKYYPNNALIFEITRQAIERSEIKLVSYGVESLNDSLEGLVKFKVDMGYELMPIKQHTVFHPILQPIVRRTKGWIVGLADKRPNNLMLQKVKGLIRFATA